MIVEVLMCLNVCVRADKTVLFCYKDIILRIVVPMLEYYNASILDVIGINFKVTLCSLKFPIFVIITH